MKILYIGQYTEGTTSKMRADTLKQVSKPESFQVIDTNIPFYEMSRVMRSFGFRYKKGPLINRVNQFIIKELREDFYDIIWVDKAVFIKPEITKILKNKTYKLVHFTPDMAFFENKSKYFNKSITLYDYIITTKTAELDIYKQKIINGNIILTTQGFDKSVHKSFNSFKEKDNSIVFIGLAEPSRIRMIELLINKNLSVKLVGKGWSSFLKKYNKNRNLNFIGDSIYNEEYSKLISSSKFSLGLLSKRFSEFHTTRTFEIPACGTALLTERNIETESFFKEDEVIFYKDEEELVSQVKFYMKNDKALETLTQKGTERVHTDGFDYISILTKILNQILN